MTNYSSPKSQIINSRVTDDVLDTSSQDWIEHWIQVGSG